MKIFLFILLFFPKILFAEWVFFSKAEGDVYNAYYNSESIKREGQFIYYHQMFDLFEPMEYNGAYFLSMKSYLKINCINFEIQPKTVKMFDEPLGEGNVIDETYVADAEWEKQSSTSMDVQINKYLCKNY